MRMFASDIEYLFKNVPVGTPIEITYEQDKIGKLNGQLYLESEVPFPELANDEALKKRIIAADPERADLIKWDQVTEISDTRLGIPKAIN